MKVVTVSGYKASELGIFKNNDPAISFIKKAIHKKVIQYIELGVEWFIFSGQLGVEEWAVDVISELKNDYSEIKMGIFLPYYNQDKSWSEPNRERYQDMLRKVDFVDTISKKEYEGPWQLQLKNQFLTQKSEGFIIVYDENHPGSPKYLIEAAVKMNRPLDFITMDDLQDVVNECTWDM